VAERWHCVAVGGVLALAACGQSESAHQLPGPATEYAGDTFERAEELPASEGAAAGTATGNAAAAGTAEFFQICARRLRDPRDGRELLLMHSQITRSTTKKSDTTVTRLDHATGDYAPMSDDPRGQSDSLYLRVDCVTGRAVGWVVLKSPRTSVTD
jgi:hypothetical protein